MPAAAPASVKKQQGLTVDVNWAPTTTSTSTNASSADDRKSPSVNTAQDIHPYQRGAVIEVWHIPKKVNDDDDDDDDDWWSDDDDDSEEEQSKEQDGGQQQRTVLLCDIIDRSFHGGNSTNNWRYYVHYRGLNRRMDEWIPISRIVSPPSVGNAKARALKKEEEKKRKLELLQELERQQQVSESTGVRSRRRSAIVVEQQQQQQLHQLQRSDTPVADGSSGGRRKRLARKRSSVLDDDDVTVGASNRGGDSGDDDLLYTSLSTGSADGTSANAAALTNKEVNTSKGNSIHGQGSTAATTKSSEILSADAAVTTMTVGEHTVATVKAVELDEHEGLDEASLREHEEVTKIKNVRFLELGRHQMGTWYFSPLPKELIQGYGSSNANTSISTNAFAAGASTPGGSLIKGDNAPAFLEVLYVCEFTFRLFARKEELQRFQKRIRPEDRHPPGNEIYRNGNLSMFEVDGLEEKIYCQNLCYIAKLFLDHKTLYYDVDPFLFYVLCEVDDRGFHPVGYYSKEKYSDVGFNLACILSFPAHQRKGYGRFLIAFSYELTKKEEKVGSPEKPMSDLGQQAYKPYWASTIIDFLLHQSDENALSIMDISKRTSIVAEDIVYTLNQLGILKIINGVYFIAAEQSLLEKLVKKYPVKEPRVDPTKLHWTPFLTDVKRDKFSIHSKKPSVEADGPSGSVMESNGGGS